MALSECKECKGTVSSEARVCPHCGVKKPAGPSALVRKFGRFIRKLALIAVGLLVVLFILGVIVREKTPMVAAEQKAKPAQASVKAKPVAEQKVAVASEPPAVSHKQDYIGCKTTESLSQLGLAASHHDRQLFTSILLSGDCNPIGDKDFSVLERGVSVSKIRLYINGPASYLDLYVPSELTR